VFIALAAFTTGGTFSDRGGGTSVGTRRPSLVIFDVVETTDVLRDVVGAVDFETAVFWVLLSVPGNSCRRTGSELAWNLEATAGVFRKAPGTIRTGVV
jgi:hypothetical protein